MPERTQLPLNREAARHAALFVREDGNFNWNSLPSSEAVRAEVFAITAEIVQRPVLGPVQAAIEPAYARASFGDKRSFSLNRLKSKASEVKSVFTTNMARKLVAAGSMAPVLLGAAACFEPVGPTQAEIDAAHPGISFAIGTASSFEETFNQEILRAAVSTQERVAQDASVADVESDSQPSHVELVSILEKLDGEEDGKLKVKISIKDGVGGSDNVDNALARTTDQIVEGDKLFDKDNLLKNGDKRWSLVIAAGLSQRHKVMDGEIVEISGPELVSLAGAVKALGLNIKHEKPASVTNTQTDPAVIAVQDLAFLESQGYMGTSSNGSGVSTNPDSTPMFSSWMKRIAAMQRAAANRVAIPAVATPEAVSGQTIAGTGQSNSESTETAESIKFKEGKFAFTSVKDEPDGSATIELAPQRRMDLRVFLNVSRTNAAVLKKDQDADKYVVVDAFERDRQINYVYRHGDHETFLYSTYTPAGLALLEEEKAKRAQEAEDDETNYLRLEYFAAVLGAMGAVSLAAGKRRAAMVLVGSGLGLEVFNMFQNSKFDRTTALGTLIPMAIILFALAARRTRNTVAVGATPVVAGGTT